MEYRVLLLAAVCASGVPAAHSASDDFPYILESRIPMFSFETPEKLQVKVFDRSRKEIRDATVFFELSPALGPPPYGHVKEMAYSKKIMQGDTADPEVRGYLDYLNTMKTNPALAVRKAATYDRSTGYYTANYTFSKFPLGIRVYVGAPGRPLQKAPAFFPHRAHCEYSDVINAELVKTSLHQVASLARKGQWADVEQKLGVIHASVHGMHGAHFTVVLHHGDAPVGVEDAVMQLHKSIRDKSSAAVLESVGRTLAALEKSSEYFINVAVRKVEAEKGAAQSPPDTYEVLVWDNINEKGITGAVVMVDENYNLETHLTNPAVVPIATADQQGVYRGLYHAKLAYLPEGVVAQQVGGGRYRFTSKDFGSGKNPKRIFVYYAYETPGMPPDKFVTKEINLPYGTKAPGAEAGKL